jgi:hypothetical protein
MGIGNVRQRYKGENVSGIDDTEWLDRMHKFGKHLEKQTKQIDRIKANEMKAYEDNMGMDYMDRISKMIDDIKWEERQVMAQSRSSAASASSAYEAEWERKWERKMTESRMEHLAEELRMKMLKELYENGFAREDDIWSTDGMPDKPKKVKKTKHLDDELFEI